MKAETFEVRGEKLIRTETYTEEVSLNELAVQRAYAERVLSDLQAKVAEATLNLERLKELERAVGKANAGKNS